MLKFVNKLANLAAVSSTLVVLGTTAVVPAAYAAAIPTAHMNDWCKSKGYTGAAFGWTPDTKFTKDAQGNWVRVGNTGYYGNFCIKGNKYKIIPNSVINGGN